MSQQQHFTHHGRSFTIDAEGWPDEESAAAAIIDLQSWALQLDSEETAALYVALDAEREALIQETPYDRSRAPLPAIRQAQRRAVRTGLEGRNPGQLQPTVSIEAWQRTEN